MIYPLPKDTSGILKDYVQINVNLGLALDKYLQVNEADVKGAWKVAEDYKKRKKCPSLNNGFLKQNNSFLKHINDRRELLWKEIQTKNSVRKFTAITSYRLVVGFGAEHVLETGICLHHVYGFPIIPGSAVKGVTRAKAFWEIAEKLEFQVASPSKSLEQQKTPLQILDELLSTKDEEEIKKLLKRLEADAFYSSREEKLTLSKWLEIAEDFHQVFGTTEQQGKVTFFDSYPTTMPFLEVDILNPHYSNYYGDKSKSTPPADYENPVPTFFLTVAKGSSFCFAIAGKEEKLVDKADFWLKQGLKDLGIGGKTSTGYGVFNLFNQ